MSVRPRAWSSTVGAEQQVGVVHLADVAGVDGDRPIVEDRGQGGVGVRCAEQVEVGRVGDGRDLADAEAVADVVDHAGGEAHDVGGAAVAGGLQGVGGPLHQPVAQQPHLDGPVGPEVAYLEDELVVADPAGGERGKAHRDGPGGGDHHVGREGDGVPGAQAGVDEEGPDALPGRFLVVHLEVDDPHPEAVELLILHQLGGDQVGFGERAGDHGDVVAGGGPVLAELVDARAS